VVSQAVPASPLSRPYALARLREVVALAAGLPSAPMIEIPRSAPGSVACGRSGLPLLAICPNGHRRAVPFRRLRTSETDRTPLYGRPFKCQACGGVEVTLFAIGSQAELDEIQGAIARPPQAARAPTTHPPPDPDKGLL
jgi:hypothetical protein